MKVVGRSSLRSRVAFNRNELGGSFGDLGTDLPLIMAMLVVNDLDAASTFIMFGLLQIFTGLAYGLPMPVQPLKAMAAIMITTGMSGELLYGAGLVVGITMLFLSLSGLITTFDKLVPRCVVRGIQIGLGMKLMLVAIGFMQEEGFGWILSLVGVLIVLALSGNKKVPPSLILIILGLFVALFTGLQRDIILGGIALSLPKFYMPSLNAMAEGGLLLAIPQLPLSIANSIMATSLLVSDLFPQRSVSVRRISMTYGVMNLVAPFVSGIPVCHGSGGLAGHHRFGARTGGSVVLYGLMYLTLGGFFASVIHEVTKIFPFPILGVLLFFEGFALLKLIRHVTAVREELSVALLVGVLIIGLPGAYGFLVGMIGGILIFEMLKRRRVEL